MTGKSIPIVEDRYCPVDVILAVPIKMPFPSADVPNAIEIETNQEYWGVDFAVTSSQFQFGNGEKMKGNSRRGYPNTEHDCGN